MKGVRVAIPLYRGKRKFHLEKGRRWSIVEHILLAALAEQAQSVVALAAAGQMHERLVIEMLIRLMRAGWVELQPTPTQLLFTVSAAGKAAAAKPELPAAATPVARWMNFVVDRITGTIFKPRELPFLHRNAITEREQHEAIVWLQPTTFENEYKVEDLVEHLFREDENFIAVERAGDRLMERYALVHVRGGKIEGLPARAPSRLMDAVLEAAEQGADSRPGEPMKIRVAAGSVAVDSAACRRPLHLADEDMLFGGEANEAALLQLIGGARERLIIHSTFVGKPAFDRLKPYLIKAAHKGARVELMWGEGDDPRSAGSTHAVVAAIREELATSGENELIRLNPFSTRSHAKFVVADRSGGKPIALIGSCNWLSSNMALFEASVRVHEPRLVADLLYQAAELSRGRDGHWNELTSQLAAYAATVARMPSAQRFNAEASILLGPAHRDILRQACNEAEHRLLLMSHRVSASARQAFLIPAHAALTARPKLAVELRYGTAPKSTEPSWEAITRGLDVTGIAVIPPVKPEAHAKLLAWDEDDVVITSQNWLSADPSESNPQREMGIYLHSARLATKVACTLGAFI
jgi:cardiolipin synthase A/B